MEFTEYTEYTEIISFCFGFCSFASQKSLDGIHGKSEVFYYLIGLY